MALGVQVEQSIQGAGVAGMKIYFAYAAAGGHSIISLSQYGVLISFHYDKKELAGMKKKEDEAVK